MMGLTVKRGMMVGIVKEGDPMGNKDRWFVDTGGKETLVICSDNEKLSIIRVQVPLTH